MQFVNVTTDSRGNYAGYPIALCTLTAQERINRDTLCNEMYDLTADDIINEDLCISNIWYIWRLLMVFAVLGFIFTVYISIKGACKKRYGVTSLQIYCERFLVTIGRWKTKEDYIDLTHPAGELARSHGRLRIQAFFAELFLEIGAAFIAIFLIKGVNDLARRRDELGLNNKFQGDSEVSESYFSVTDSENTVVLSLCTSLIYEGVGFMSYGFRHFLLFWKNTVIAILLVWSPAAVFVIGTFLYIGGAENPTGGNILILLMIAPLSVYALFLYWWAQREAEDIAKRREMRASIRASVRAGNQLM